MASRWSWDVAGFEQRKSSSASSSPPPYRPVPGEKDAERRFPVAPLRRRYSIAASLPWDSPESSKQTVGFKVLRLKDKVKMVKNDYLELRQEAFDLQEYSNAKLERATRYLRVLAEKTRKLDELVVASEARISPLMHEKKKLFDDLLTAKGNIKFFCRVRPLFEEEGPSAVEFPENGIIRVNTKDDSFSNSKKDFEFDKVYGPHIGQAEFFVDVQPFVQSALDGCNVSIFAYGQNLSGKTHTMEGSSHDRGLYARCFEELFDLAHSESSLASQFDFSVTIFEIYNEQVNDLLFDPEINRPMARLGSSGSYIEVALQKVDNPLEYAKITKNAFQKRGTDILKFRVSHLLVIFHISFTNLISREKLYSKLALVDLAGSEGIITEEDSNERVADLLHVMKSHSALGDVLSSLTSKKDDVPYENSLLTSVLSDSLGGTSKTLIILNLNPHFGNLSETLTSLNFCARARSSALSLGNRDTIKKWRDIANDARKELLDKEKEVQDMTREVWELRGSLKDANDQCVLLFNEAQKAWKVSSTVQSELKSENLLLAEKQKQAQEHNVQLQNQVAHLMQVETDQKLLMQQRDSTITLLQGKLNALESQLNDVVRSGVNTSAQTLNHGDNNETSLVTKKLEEELKERDALIEKLHDENEKLFGRLTEKVPAVLSNQISSPLTKATASSQPWDLASCKDREAKGYDVPTKSVTDKSDARVAMVKSGPDLVKSTPAGEYLTAALNDFDLEQFDSLAAVSDGVNKLLMLVLAAVIKAGASREHEILAEIRDSVFAFIRKMESKRVMDTMLVSRVRILYIRSLLARSPELQSIKASSVESFLEKSGTDRSRGSSRGNSPARSPVRYAQEPIYGFKVNIKPERKSKLSTVVLRMRGIDQDSWKQQVTGGKLREIQEDAKSFALGNKPLAALFVHTPAGELQRQIRLWLAANFDFLSVTGSDSSAEATGQLDLLSTAIIDGWMSGLGAARPPSTDALGQLLGDYARRVYSSQLQHLKDIAGTLATEEADSAAQGAKLRSALESVDHKRRKVLQQLRSDTALLTTEEGGLPMQLPSTAAEDARLASLISLDAILKQAKDISRQSSSKTLSKTKKKTMLDTLEELEERMPSLLDIDHPTAQRHIAEARQAIECVPAENDCSYEAGRSQTASGSETDVVQWNVLQFNTGSSTSPFIIKCGANSKSELVIKADAKVQEPKGDEIVRVVPRPSVLENSSLDEIKDLFSQLPEALSLLALARTADGTRARYSRLYRTLAMKVPSLRDLVGELEKGGVLKDVRS